MIEPEFTFTWVGLQSLQGQMLFRLLLTPQKTWIFGGMDLKQCGVRLLTLPELQNLNSMFHVPAIVFLCPRGASELEKTLLDPDGCKPRGPSWAPSGMVKQDLEIRLVPFL